MQHAANDARADQQAGHGQDKNRFPVFAQLLGIEVIARLEDQEEKKNEHDQVAVEFELYQLLVERPRLLERFHGAFDPWQVLFVLQRLDALLLGAIATHAEDDPYLWLEEVEGEEAAAAGSRRVKAA